MKNIIKLITNNQLAIGLLVINAVLLIIFTPTHYYFEMFQSMAFQFMIGIITLMFLFAFYKRWAGTLTCILAIILLAFHLPLAPITSNIESNTSVAHFNVYKHNNKYKATIDAALKSEADLLSFNEVSPLWALQLKRGLKNEYPYFSIQLAENNSFGIAIFSKHELNNIEVHYWGSKTIPTLSGSTILAGEEVTFVAAHTIPPTSKAAFSIRNNHLHEIKNYMQKIKGPKILVGDLNAVSWSENLQAIKQENKLQDSRSSWLPTYPSWNRFLAIPIDHIFYSNDFVCTNFETIKTTKSDHYGIKSEFYVESKYSKR